MKLSDPLLHCFMGASEKERAAALAYYYRNRDEVLKRRKARRAARTPEERARDYENLKRWKKTNPRSDSHGLSRNEVAARLAAQGGACACCGAADVKFWHGDHDHATGIFRAVLCNRCNMGLGLFDDEPARLRAAAEYLEHHRKMQSLM